MNKDDTEYLSVVTEQIKDLIPEYSEESFKGLGLTPQEIAFCFEYINGDFDGVAAYERVYGCDRKHAVIGARKYVARKDIQNGYNILLDEVWEVAQNILPLQLLSDLNAVRSMDIFDYYYSDGTPRPLEEIPAEKRKLIDGIELMLDKQGVAHTNYKLPDRRKTAGTMLELIKIRSFNQNGKGEAGSDAEAKAMRDKIFGGVL